MFEFLLTIQFWAYAFMTLIITIFGSYYVMRWYSGKFRIEKKDLIKRTKRTIKRIRNYLEVDRLNLSPFNFIKAQNKRNGYILMMTFCLLYALILPINVESIFPEDTIFIIIYKLIVGIIGLLMFGLGMYFIIKLFNFEQYLSGAEDRQPIYDICTEKNDYTELDDYDKEMFGFTKDEVSEIMKTIEKGK